jgi:N,N'-diacetyllegionaminate synthase
MKNFHSLKKPFIVAEIGNNHEGSLNTAIKLIKAAKNADADAVKFQVFDPCKYSSPKDKARISLLKKFALNKSQIIKIKKYCKKLNIIFFATPFDIKSAEFLNKHQNFFKISSGDNNYIQLFKKIISFKKPLIISTGLMGYTEIKEIINFIQKKNFYKKKENLCLMHCVSAYPASKKKINLNSILFLKKKFPNITIGYSDHTLGKKVACLSSVIGAEIIEKHFTLDNNFSDFRDHKISLDPKSFKNFVKEVKELSIILGSLKKETNVEEKINKNSMRRKIVTNKKIKKGSKLNVKDLIFVRSVNEGIHASNLNKYIGKKLTRNKEKFSNFLTSDFI